MSFLFFQANVGNPAFRKAGLIQLLPCGLGGGKGAFKGLRAAAQIRLNLFQAFGLVASQAIHILGKSFEGLFGLPDLILQADPLDNVIKPPAAGLSVHCLPFARFEARQFIFLRLEAFMFGFNRFGLPFCVIEGVAFVAPVSAAQFQELELTYSAKVVSARHFARDITRQVAVRFGIGEQVVHGDGETSGQVRPR